MVELSPEELRRVQLTELELLCEADRICRKCGISYNIIAGTLLGAVRGGGFIPWDDDADIALLRPEYERFRTACETELDASRFYFQDHRNTPGYRWGYGKLRRKGTLFLREHQEHMPYEQGIFIDIFPLDAVPAGLAARRWHDIHCWAIRKLLWSEAGRRADRSALMRLWYGFLAKVPLAWIFSHYERFVRKGNAENAQSPWVRILTFPAPTADGGYLRAWYEHSTATEFENHSFSGIADFDSYLSFKFGKWKELPPMEQRKVHPVSKLKLLDGR